MRLTSLAIFVATLVLVVVSPTSSTAQSQSDPISGKWDSVLQVGENPENLVKAKLDLKLDGETVTGTFASSSRLGNGAINGSWANNTLRITLESSHTMVVLTGTLNKEKLSGEFVAAGHMQGRWEAKKNKSKENSSQNKTHRPRKH